MLCKCGKNVDNLYHNGIVYQNMSICHVCRSAYFPDHISKEQYGEYWKFFSEKEK